MKSAKLLQKKCRTPVMRTFYTFLLFLCTAYLATFTVRVLPS